MLNGKKVIIVMPAYNASKTLIQTYNGIPKCFADEIVLVDDFSTDATIEIAQQLDLTIIRHDKNLGYGANQKTCYNYALEKKADIIIMLHPDNQYEAKLSPVLASMIAYDNYDCALASRFLLGNAKKSKMPRYKYFANRFLTFFQNLLLNQNLSEYHSGYRAYSAIALSKVDYNNFSNDFIFDNQMLASLIYQNLTIGEISCPTKYFDGASSISFKRSLKYGFGVLETTLLYLFAKIGMKSKLFK